jgi:hypothetical protein
MVMGGIVMVMVMVMVMSGGMVMVMPLIDSTINPLPKVVTYSYSCSDNDKKVVHRDYLLQISFGQQFLRHHL